MTLKERQQRKRVALILAGLLCYNPATIATLANGAVAYAETYYSYAPNDDDCYVTDTKEKSSSPDDADSSTPTNTSSGSASDSDFTQKGSRAYKVAKNTWDGWVSKGLNGSMIAGILGNIGGAENMSWILDLEEYGGGGGGGLYQFTPFTKYTGWSGFEKDWNELNQINFILASEPNTILEYIKQSQGKSPRETAYLFGRLYERPLESAFQASLKSRQDVAEQAYKLFNGSSVKQDDSKIAKWSGGTPVASNPSDTKTKSKKSSDLPNVSASDWELVLVNREHKKTEMNPSTVDVGGKPVDSRIADKVQAFLNEAKGINSAFHLISGYRSVASQETIYNGYVQQEMSSRGISREEAEKIVQTYSQPAGASEHMTGLAIDISTVDSLNQMDEGTASKLKEIGEKHGFIRRFESSYSSKTGVNFEDWHFRYVGTEVAKYLNKKNISLEEFIEQLENGGTEEKPKEEVDCPPPPCDDGSDKPVTTNTNSNTNTSSSGVSSLEQKIDEFVNKHEEAYINSWKIGGFLPSASIVQTIAEVSFSDAVPSFAQAHNMGGVKFSGQSYTATKKLYGSDAVSATGPGVTVGDDTGGSYAYFKSFDAGIVGKAEFMSTQTLYKGAINNTDGIATLDAIADGGWATDGNYKNVLRKLYNQYGERYKWLDERAIAKHGKTPFKGDTSTATVTPLDSTTGLSVTCNDDTGSGGDGWQKKGGNSGYTSVMYWKADDLPNNLKEYALDPKSIGMSWKNGKGWESASNYIASGILDQCTTFSAAAFGSLWQKDNKNLGSFGLSGHGVELVGQAEKALGIKGSTTPTSGDLISMTPNHTGIVSHVFDNGDILIVEQNVIGYSGGGNSEQYNWSYSYQTVSSQKQNNYTFINPSSLGYKVNPNAKSVG